MDILVPLIVIGTLGFTIVSLVLRWIAPAERSWLARILAIGLVCRLALAVVFAAVPETRVFHEDAVGYELVGEWMAQSWHDERPPVTELQDEDQNTGYYYVAAAIDYVLPYQVSPSLMNAVLGMMTIFFVYRLARSFFHPLVARRAALLTAFMPSMILWNSMALKDTLMSLLIIVSLHSCVQLKRRFSVVALLGVVLPIVAIQPIRFYIVYFLGFAILVSMLFDRGVRSLTGIYKQLAIVAGAVLLLALVGATSRVVEGTSVLDLKHVSTFRHGMATTANSGFDADVDISTPGAALLFLPYGIATLLLGPFPWQLGSLRALFAMPETIVWWLMVPATVRGLRLVLRERWREASPLLIFTSTLTVGYSLMHGNIGSAFRQRAQIFILLFLFAALGMYQRRCRLQGIDEHLLLE